MQLKSLWALCYVSSLCPKGSSVQSCCCTLHRLSISGILIPLSETLYLHSAETTLPKEKVQISYKTVKVSR